MLAEEFGYRVLPGAALDTPGVEEILRSRERRLRPGLAILAAEVALLALVAMTEGPVSPAVVILVILLVSTAAPVLLWRRARRRERAVMSMYGWQVWPCATETVRVVAAEGRRDRGRNWAGQSRVVLLRPDGQAQCSFPPPEEGARPVKEVRTPPEKGTRPAKEIRTSPEKDTRPVKEVWFAGDTRFGGMLAAPGGLPFRYVVRAKPGRARGTAQENRVARASGLMPRSWRPRD
ncbi:hypothetical protein [Streptosporangium sp. NPDC000396]|uniref:hypothetical protein n=1 Tax=Streptosporangium sp. NPDC000396 TaxID=3366185 RepID=UPI0036B3D618